jgi:hypothetical protein
MLGGFLAERRELRGDADGAGFAKTARQKACRRVRINRSGDGGTRVGGSAEERGFGG